MRELVSFFRWLLLDEEGSIEPSVNTFAFEFLAKAGEEELLSLAIDIIPVDFSVDVSVKKFNLLTLPAFAEAMASGIVRPNALPRQEPT